VPRRADVSLSGAEREVLERWARRPKSSQALALRCRIALAAAEGAQTGDIATRLGCHPSTVGKWRGRFASWGLNGLHDEPRPGKPRSIADEDITVIRTIGSVSAESAAPGIDQNCQVRPGLAEPPAAGRG